MQDFFFWNAKNGKKVLAFFQKKWYNANIHKRQCFAVLNRTRFRFEGTSLSGWVSFSKTVRKTGNEAFDLKERKKMCSMGAAAFCRTVYAGIRNRNFMISDLLNLFYFFGGVTNGF